MAKQLNKKLVVGLTISAMVVTAAAGVILVATLPETDPAYYVEQAKGAIKRGDNQAAARLYNRAWRVSNDPKYLVEAGTYVLKAGDARAATNMWQQAIIADPKLEAAHQKIIELHLEYAKLGGLGVRAAQDMREAADRLLEINPDNSLGLHARGMAKLALRSVDEELAGQGEEDVKRALELAPDNADYAETLANYYVSTDRFQDANAVYEGVLAINADDAKAHRYYGSSLLKRVRLDDPPSVRDQSFDKSYEHLAKAAELDPNDVENFIALGEYWRVRALVGKRDETIARMHAASQTGATTQPGEVPTTSSQPAAAIGEYFAKSEAALRQAVTLDPGGYMNYLALGALYRSMEDLPKAVATYDERLNKGIVRATFMPERDRFYKQSMLREAFRATVDQIPESETDTKKRDALLAKAEEYYRKAIAEAEAGEKAPYVLVMKGRLLTFKGETRAAIEAFLDAEHRMPQSDPQVSFYLANLYRQVGETGEAERRLVETVQRFPANETALTMLAGILNVNDKPDMALQVATRALQLNPDNAIALRNQIEAYRRLGNWDKVRELTATIATKEGTQEKSHTFVREGLMARLEAEDNPAQRDTLLARAETAFRTALDHDPTNINALHQMAALLAQTNHLEEMKAFIDKALAALPEDSTDPDVTLRRSNIRLIAILADPKSTVADKVKATENLIAATSYKDEYVRELDYVELYARASENDRAIEHLKKAMQLQPDEPAVITWMFRLGTASQKYDLAEQAVQRVAKLDLDGVNGHLWAGRLALMRQDTETALNELRTAVTMASTHSDAHAWYGQALAVAGRTDEAAAEFRRAVEINPNHPLAHIGLAKLALQRGDERTYEEHLARARKLAPNSDWVQEQVQLMQDRRNPEGAIIRREEARRNFAEDKTPNRYEQIDNLFRLNELYRQVGKEDEAEAALVEAMDVVKAASDIDAQRAAVVPATYAQFLLTKKEPEPKRGLKVLEEYRDAHKEDKTRVRIAQMRIARYMRQWSGSDLADRPSQEDVDAAYDAALTVDPTFNALLEVGNWYASTNRLTNAESLYRRAIKTAGDNREQERQARRVLISMLVSAQDIERRDEIDQMIADYRRRFPEDPAALYLLSEHQMRTGRSEAAVASLTDFLEQSPENPDAYFRRGLLYFRQGDWHAAADDLHKAKLLAPTAYDYRHRILLSECFVRLDQPDSAVAELNSILEEDPTAQYVAQRLVNIYVRQGRYDEAEARTLEYSRRFPNSYSWPLGLAQLQEARPRAEQDPIQIIGYYRTAAKVGKYQPELVQKAMQAMLRYGRFDDLIAYADEVPEKSIGLMQTLLIAQAHARKGEPDKARERLQVALEHTAANPDTFGRVVEQYAAILGPDEAIDQMNQRLAKDPNDLGAMRGLALVHSRIGMTARTKGEADQANAEEKKVQELLKKALAQTENNTDRVALLQLLGRSYLVNKEYTEACDSYTKLLEIAPNDVLALNNLAYILMEYLKRPTESLEYAKRAAQLAPEEPDVLDTYGWNLALLERYRDAMGPLSNALGESPDSIIVLYHRALTQAKLANSTEAKEEKTQLLDQAKVDLQRAYDEAIKTNKPDHLDEIKALAGELGMKLAGDEASATSQQGQSPSG